MENSELIPKRAFFKNLKSPLFLMLASAILLVLSFPKFNLYFFAWIALVPLLLALRNEKLPDLFLFAFVAGAVFSFSVFFELYCKAIPLVSFMVIIYGLNFGIFACLTAFFYKKTRQEDILQRVLFASCAYVFIFEYLRSFELFGADVNILAYSQYKFLPVIQICDITGVYGLSFLIVLFNAYLAEMIIKMGTAQKKRDSPQTDHLSGQSLFFCAVPILIIILACFGYGLYKLNLNYVSDKKFAVTIIQPNIDSKRNDVRQNNIDEKMFELFLPADKAASVKTDLIVFPEAVFPGYILLDQKLQKYVIDFIDSRKINILIGGYHYDYNFQKPYNGVFLAAHNKGIKDFYFKNRLFPFGEYNPIEFLEFSKYIVLEGRQYFTAGARQTVFDLDGGKFAAFVCFESLFSSYARSAAIKGAEFLAVLTDDEWFEASGVVRQHLIASLFRAVENRRYLIQAANTGYSAIIDPCGRINEISGLFTAETLTGDIYALSKKSIFTKYGEWFLWLCGAVVIIGLIVGRKNEQ